MAEGYVFSWESNDDNRAKRLDGDLISASACTANDFIRQEDKEREGRNSGIIPLDFSSDFCIPWCWSTERKYQGKFQLISEKTETSPIKYHQRKERHETEFLHVITMAQKSAGPYYRAS